MGEPGMRVVYKEGMKIILRTTADLHLRGWAESDIEVAPSDAHHLQVREDGSLLNIYANEDLWVSVPAKAEIRIEHTGGDALVSNLEGAIEVLHVGGDLTLRGASKVDVGHVSGDFAAADVRESLAVRRVGGDLSAQVTGSVAVELAGGDILLDAKDGVRVRSGGDLEVSIAGGSSDEVVLKAGGDISLFVPADLDARLDLTSGGRSIEIDVADQKRNYEDENVIVTFGKGTRPLRAKAGGDLRIGDEPFDVQDIYADLGVLDEEWAPSGGHGRHAEHWSDLEERIQRRAEEASRRAEERVRAAMERVERMNRHQEHAFGKFDKWLGFFGVGGRHFEPPAPPEPPEPPAPPTGEVQPSSPVAEADFSTASNITNDERMLVLKMLQEHKLTVEEAEQLLASLEGQFD